MGVQDRADIIRGGSVILVFFQLVIMTGSADFFTAFQLPVACILT